MWASLKRDDKETGRQAGGGDSTTKKNHTEYGVLYWLCLRRGGGRHGDWGGGPGGRPGLHYQVVSHHHWVVGAAGDGFDHFGHLELEGWVGRALSKLH